MIINYIFYTRPLAAGSFIYRPIFDRESFLPLATGFEDIQTVYKVLFIIHDQDQALSSILANGITFNAQVLPHRFGLPGVRAL